MQHLCTSLVRSWYKGGRFSPSPGSGRVCSLRHLSPLHHPPPEEDPKRLLSCGVLLAPKGEAAFVSHRNDTRHLNGKPDTVRLEGPHQPTLEAWPMMLCPSGDRRKPEDPGGKAGSPARAGDAGTPSPRRKLGCCCPLLAGSWE